jgi:hypothetical protein
MMRRCIEYSEYNALEKECDYRYTKKVPVGKENNLNDPRENLEDPSNGLIVAVVSLIRSLLESVIH